MAKEKATKKAKKDISPLADVQKNAQVQETAAAESAAQYSSAQLVDEEQLEATAVAAETDTDAAVPAEEAAVHTDTPVAKAASGDGQGVRRESAPQVDTSSKRPRKKPISQRSKKYVAATVTLDRSKPYELTKAIDQAKQGSYSKFDGTLSLDIRLKPRKSDSESIRGLVQLPHGSGKAVDAVILTEELIETIKKDGKTSHSILIATPQLMPKVAKIAKILGPQGKMPSPKAGTVSDTPEDVLAALNSGRVEYRADASGIIHQAIGKVSWETKTLEENATALLGALVGYQLLSVTVSATMGPGVRVDLSTLN